MRFPSLIGGNKHLLLIHTYIFLIFWGSTFLTLCRLSVLLPILIITLLNILGHPLAEGQVFLSVKHSVSELCFANSSYLDFQNPSSVSLVLGNPRAPIWVLLSCAVAESSSSIRRGHHRFTRVTNLAPTDLCSSVLDVWCFENYCYVCFIWFCIWLFQWGNKSFLVAKEVLRSLSALGLVTDNCNSMRGLA